MNRNEFECKYGLINLYEGGYVKYSQGDGSFLDRLFCGELISDNFLKIIGYVIDVHGVQMRKGSDVPYWTHVVRVGYRSYKTVLSNNEFFSMKLFFIGCLHDVIEDCVKGDGSFYRLVDIYDFLKNLLGNANRELIKSILVGVDNLTEKYTSANYPFLNRAERKDFELLKYSTIRIYEALVKQEDIRDNFMGPAGYILDGGGFAKKWCLESMKKLDVLRLILGQKFDLELYNQMKIFVSEV